MNTIETEQHRKQCEARQLLKYPKEKRVAHYEAVQKIRGQKAVLELIDEVKRQHKLQEEKTVEVELSR